MEQRRLTEIYNDRQLDVLAFEVQPGRWAWWFLIYGERSSGNSTRPGLSKSAEAALAIGLAAAKAQATERGF